MKNKIIIVMVTLFAVLSITAQSDYQKVQNFKNKVEDINASIERVQGYEVYDSLNTVIDSLRQAYANDKELLDKSLYPDDFNSIFEKLENKLKTYRANFASVGDLKAQVVSLQNQLNRMNDENSELLEQIRQYQRVGGSDKASVNELKRLVVDLRTKLKKRDDLVRGLVDSLLSDYMQHPMTLNDAEKQQLYEQIETGNLFYNVEKTVRDNMDFLKATELSADDLGQLKEDQVQFYNMWKKTGQKLADVYMDQGEKAGEVAYITNLFSQWNQKINKEIWDNVSQSIRDNGFKVKGFNDGEEFTSSLLDFLDEAKTEMSESDYDKFEDLVWTEELRAKWLPILIDNNMLTVAQRDSIKEALDEWGALYETETPIYWYIAIAVIIIVFLLIFIPKGKKNKPLAEQK